LSITLKLACDASAVAYRILSNLGLSTGYLYKEIFDLNRFGRLRSVRMYCDQSTNSGSCVPCSSCPADDVTQLRDRSNRCPHTPLLCLPTM